LNDQHPGRHRLRDHRRARLNDRAHQRRYSGTTPVATDYVTTDALGSTIGLINGTSTSPVRDYSYDPDGNATSTGSGPAVDIRYAGGQASQQASTTTAPATTTPAPPAGPNQTR
jgi:hypothetical protein